MPFTWSIKINRNGTPSAKAQFDPNPLVQVAPGDQIFWNNNDDVAHWPGLVNDNGTINETFFMPNQIAPQSSSEAFSSATAGTLNYACSLHEGETGSIEISQLNS